MQDIPFLNQILENWMYLNRYILLTKFQAHLTQRTKRTVMNIYGSKLILSRVLSTGLIILQLNLGKPWWLIAETDIFGMCHVQKWINNCIICCCSRYAASIGNLAWSPSVKYTRFLIFVPSSLVGCHSRAEFQWLEFSKGTGRLKTAY